MAKTRGLTTIDRLVAALGSANASHTEEAAEVRKDLQELRDEHLALTGQESSKFVEERLREPMRSEERLGELKRENESIFGEHLANLQTWMREVSCYTHHLTNTPDFRAPHRLRSLNRQGLRQEVERCIFVLELGVVKDVTTSSSVLGRGSEDAKSVWHARAHLNAIDAKLHVPFLLRLIEFFVRPRMELPIRMMDDHFQKDANPIIMATACDWRLDVIIRQLDVLLINHTHGPNMPLCQLRLRDGYLLAVHQALVALQLDAQLPIDALSYNFELETPVFESLLEPLVLVVRLAKRPRKMAIFDSLHTTAGYNATSVHLAASPMNFTLTQTALASLLVFLPSVQRSAELSLGPRSPKGTDPAASAGRSADSDAALGFIRSPYWVHNNLGIEVDAGLEQRSSHGFRVDKPAANVNVAKYSSCALPMLTSSVQTIVNSPFEDGSSAAALASRAERQRGVSDGAQRKKQRPPLLVTQTVCISYRGGSPAINQKVRGRG